MTDTEDHSTILELIAELRQAKAERDWMAEVLSKHTGLTPSNWLEAAHANFLGSLDDAIDFFMEEKCQKQNSERK